MSKRSLTGSLVLLCLMLLALPATADDDDRFLEVSGSGFVEAVPDTLGLVITIEQTSPTAAEATAAVDRRTRELVKTLRDLKIDERDIDSSSIAVQPRYDWRNNQRVYEGETVRRAVRVMLRDTARYGQLISTVVKQAPDAISPPSLTHSNIDVLGDEALANAIARATERARAMAAASGVKLGKVLRVRESSGGSAPEMMYVQARMSADAMSAAPVEVDFGKQRISAEVQLRFAID